MALALILAGPPGAAPEDGAASSTEVPEPADARPQLRALALRTEDIDRAALADALRLRLPGLEVTTGSLPPQDPDAPALDLFARVDSGSGPDEYLLTLVASDGRAFDRRIETAPEQDAQQRAATVARTIAVLVPGIEAGTVAPDRADVAIPDEARDDCEPCPEPQAPPPEPETLEAVPPPPPPTEEPPRVELGPRVGLALATGLGSPGDVDRFAGAGPALGFAVRLRSGALVVAGARFITRTGGDDDGPRTRVSRLRVHVAGGYVWRPRGAFELESLAGISVEPWWVHRDGSRVSFDDASPPLVGGMLRVAPGGRWQRERVAIRVGAFAELALAWLPRAGAGVARISARRSGALVPLFRMGGPEVVFGLETRVWLGVR